MLANLLAAMPGSTSVDSNARGNNRSITIAGPDDTFLLIEPRSDRYQWCLRNDSLDDCKNLQLEITDARSFSARESAFRNPMGFRFRWPVVEQLPSGHLSRGEVFLRFEGDKFGFGDTTGTHLLQSPNGDPSTRRRWLLSMRVVGLSAEWPIELDLGWMVGTKSLELMEHAAKRSEEPASPQHCPNLHPLSDPFTFFKEPRRDNPHPTDNSLWDGFEQANRSAVQHPVSSDLRMLRVGRPVATGPTLTNRAD